MLETAKCTYLQGFPLNWVSARICDSRRLQPQWTCKTFSQDLVNPFLRGNLPKQRMGAIYSALEPMKPGPQKEQCQVGIRNNDLDSPGVTLCEPLLRDLRQSLNLLDPCS